MPVIVAALSWSWRETEVDPLTGHVDDDGFLWFRAVGGWDAQVRPLK